MAIDNLDLAMQSVSDFIVQMNTPGSKIQQAVTNLEIAAADEQARVFYIIQLFLESTKLAEKAQAEAEAILEFCLEAENKELRKAAAQRNADAVQQQLQAIQAQTSFVPAQYESLCSERDEVNKEFKQAVADLVVAASDYQNKVNAVNNYSLDELKEVIDSLPLSDKEKDNLLQAFKNAPSSWEVRNKVGSGYNPHIAAVTDVVRALTSTHDEEKDGYIDRAAAMLVVGKKLDPYISAKMSKESIAEHEARIQQAEEAKQIAEEKKAKVEEKSSLLDAYNNTIDLFKQRVNVDVEETTDDNDDWYDENDSQPESSSVPEAACEESTATFQEQDIPASLTSVPLTFFFGDKEKQVEKVDASVILKMFMQI